MDSIILNPELKSTIIKDVENFLQSENWYQSMGIPYRRGYILHGPPGTGKTSFIFALAGHLKMDLSLVNLTLPNLTDSELASALCDSPQNSILVFEDIDVAMAKKKKKKGGDGDNDESSESRVTLSGRIVFMTTNNIGSLPAALLRPGRVDRRFHFPNATVDVAIGLFVRFYGLTLGVEEAYRIGSVVVEKLLIPEKEYGIAQLQGFYSRHRDDPAGIIDCVDDFLKEIQEQQQTTELAQLFPR
ncbi:mitochondrial chaperone bcs1 [Obelidium mucronatum]|nr:mitochondrial chaperone bcs1 [Obelidium mucronatum]